MSLPLPSKATATPAAPAISIAVALATIAALWGTLLSLHLTPALFTALLTFGGTRALARSLLRWRPGLRYSQVWALALMLALLGTLGAVLIERVAEATAVGAAT